METFMLVLTLLGTLGTWVLVYQALRTEKDEEQ